MVLLSPNWAAVSSQRCQPLEPGVSTAGTRRPPGSWLLAAAQLGLEEGAAGHRWLLTAAPFGLSERTLGAADCSAILKEFLEILHDRSAAHWPEPDVPVTVAPGHSPLRGSWPAPARRLAALRCVPKLEADVGSLEHLPGAELPLRD